MIASHDCICVEPACCSCHVGVRGMDSARRQAAARRHAGAVAIAKAVRLRRSLPLYCAGLHGRRLLSFEAPAMAVSAAHVPFGHSSLATLQRRVHRWSTDNDVCSFAYMRRAHDCTPNYDYNIAYVQVELQNGTDADVDLAAIWGRRPVRSDVTMAFHGTLMARETRTIDFQLHNRSPRLFIVDGVERACSSLLLFQLERCALVRAVRVVYGTLLWKTGVPGFVASIGGYAPVPLATAPLSRRDADARAFAQGAEVVDETARTQEAQRFSVQRLLAASVPPPQAPLQAVKRAADPAWSERPPLHPIKMRRIAS